MARLEMHVTRSGEQAHEVSCAYCDTRFRYTNRAQVVGKAAVPVFGSGTGEEAARASAEEQLRGELEAVRPVRCPGCDRFQPNMVPAFRRELSAPWLIGVGAVGALATGWVMFFAEGAFWNSDVVWAAVPSVFVAAMLAIVAASFFIDPNAHPRWRQRHPLGKRG